MCRIRQGVMSRVARRKVWEWWEAHAGWEGTHLGPERPLWQHHVPLVVAQQLQRLAYRLQHVRQRVGLLAALRHAAV